MFLIKKKYILFTLTFAALLPSTLNAQVASETLIETVGRQLSALVVSVKQQAVAASQQAQSVINSSKTLANAIGTLKLSGKYIDIYLSFSPPFGQPTTNLCESVANGKLAVAAREESKENAKTLTTNYVTARVPTLLDRERESVESHFTLYCSLEEEKAGVCKREGNGMQSWDANYSGAFSVSTVSPESELAGYAYIMNVSDYRAPESIDCKTVECSAASNKYRQTMAFSSLIANTYVQQITNRRIPNYEE